jgi:3-hydroxyacyl-[acyl-carrier-protein] dehydratase
MLKLDKKEIENLLPHRDPMLLIDELHDIKNLLLLQALLM